MSYPKKGTPTKRYRDIIVQTAQSESGWYFSGVESTNEARGSWEEKTKKDEQENRLLEAICVQHEIDHLNGLTIHDRENKTKPMVSQKKVGRNDPCPCGSGKKFKKCCINK